MKNMKKYNHSGTAIIHIMIFVVLWLVSTFLFFILYSIVSGYEQDIAIIEKQKKDLEQHKLNLSIRLQQIESLTGFFPVENKRDLKEAKTDIPKLLANLKKLSSYQDENGSRSFYGLSTLPSIDEISEETLHTSYNIICLEKSIQAFVYRIEQLQAEQRQIQTSIDRFKMMHEIKNKDNSQLIKQLEEEIETLDQNKITLSDNLKTKLEHIQDLKHKFEDEIALKEEECKKLEKVLSLGDIKHKNQIDDRKSKIRKSQASKYGRTSTSENNRQREFDATEEKEDGTIVFSDPKSKNVYINLGKEHKIKLGTKFEIYRIAKQGKKELKGRIEIQKVMDKVSQALVIEVKDILDPVVTGDMIINPIFNLTSPIYIAFAGSFGNQDKIKKNIEKLGAKIETEVTAKTNFVIVGKKGEEHVNYISAISFGVPLMSEEILLKYLGD
jgi:NAD-dependent DNA ligase